MSELKCPFCNGELVGTIGHPICRNQNCVMCDDPMPQDLLEELIRTRKALDVAVNALNKINMRCQNTVRNHLERATIRGELCDISFYARKAIDDIDNLAKITALEQKDK